MSRFNEIPLSAVRHVQALADQPTQSTTQELKAEFDANSETIANEYNRMIQQLNTFEPAGAIMQFAGSTAPAGWLICDGSEVPRSSYPDLYEVIGDLYGAPTTPANFVLPNLKGRVPVGLDVSQTEFNSIGKQGGENKHKITLSEMPGHSHTITSELVGSTETVFKGTVGTSGTSRNKYLYTDGALSTTSRTTEIKGNSSEHNNLQPYIVMNYIIRT